VIDVYGRDMGNSRKFHNVSATSQVTFVVDDIVSFDPWVVRCFENARDGRGADRSASDRSVEGFAARRPVVSNPCSEALYQVRKLADGAMWGRTSRSLVVRRGPSWSVRAAARGSARHPSSAVPPRSTVTGRELVRSRATMGGVRTYSIVVEPEEDGGFLATVPALPGCFTRASTVEECRERAAEAIEVHIAGLVADGASVPEEAGKPQLLSVTVTA
jgi:predicted RNase H-like HicB family nuclease